MFAQDSPSKGVGARTAIEAPPTVECAAFVVLGKSAAAHANNFLENTAVVRLLYAALR